MTTDQAKAEILARIGDTRYHADQAAAEGRHDMTALESWEYLFFWKNDHAAARAWWQTEIAPLFAAEETSK